MASLNTSLSIGVSALQAATGAINATNNNIANANTPGYAREVPVLNEGPSYRDGNVQQGSGVLLQGYQSIRSELINLQLHSQSSTQAAASAQANVLQQIEPSFTTSSSDIGTDLSALFTSLSQLSTNPANTSLRQQVLSAGQNLAQAFNAASRTLTSLQSGLNKDVSTQVDQVNKLASQIANLEPQLAALKASGQDGGELQDQIDQLTSQLSQLTSVNITQTENGPTITTGNGTPLVVGNTAYALQTTTATDGLARVLDSQGNDITSSLRGGSLGGTLTVQQQTIPNILSQLDTLTYQLGQAFNNAQAAGYDANGNQGQAFFNLPAGPAGVAGSISLALTSASQVAASSDGTAGSNGNLQNFAEIQTTALPSGSTPGDAYASLVYQVGSLTANAQAEVSATTASITQLQAQQSAISGVSLDEEATNLLRFQQAYEAAARVVSVVNSLFTVVINMGSPT